MLGYGGKLKGTVLMVAACAFFCVMASLVKLVTHVDAHRKLRVLPRKWVPQGKVVVDPELLEVYGSHPALLTLRLLRER